MQSDAQKSETHATTDDASTSPASDAGTGATGPGGHVTPERNPKRTREDELHGTAGGNPGEDMSRKQDLFPEGTKVKRDDSDAGGPIEIETDQV